MAYGIRTGDPRGFNKGRSSKICVASQVRQTPEKAGGPIDRNVVEITMMMKTTVRKPSTIKIDNSYFLKLSENFVTDFSCAKRYKSERKYFKKENADS